MTTEALANRALRVCCVLSVLALGGCSDDPVTHAPGTQQGGASGGAASPSSGTAATAGLGGASGAAGVSAAGSSPSAAGGVATGAAAVGGGSARAGSSAGPAGASGNAGGTAGVPASAGAVKPTERDGKYQLVVDELLIEIDPSAGGRISKLLFAGQNLLTGPDVDATNWGSTFWPSPQQRWSWPPVPELDSQPYTGGISGDAIVLTSQVGQRAKVRVSKRFSARAESAALDVEYTLTNEDTTAVAWAGWEVSRVAPGGITFFPSGTKIVNSELAVVGMGAITWYEHEPSTLPMEGRKYSADGAGGWLAHVAGSTLLVKKWSDVPAEQQAPAPEAEIAIYAAPRYVELEPQGPYTQLMPGESLTWSVRWIVEQLSADARAEVGNAALVELAQSLVR